MLEHSRDRLHESELAQVVADFREYGVAVIENVWESSSVDRFREYVLENAKRKDDQGRWKIDDDDPNFMLPTLNPTFRQVVRNCLSSSLHKGHAGLFEAVWKITDPEFEQAWHKDRSHDFLGQKYTLPRCIHIGSYFEDTDEDSGTTEFIFGSHRDDNLGPLHSPAARVFPKKCDAIVFDQRTWHRAPRRGNSSTRIFVFGGYVSVELYGPAHQRKLPQSWLAALSSSEDDEEKVLLGGRWDLGSWQIK